MNTFFQLIVFHFWILLGDQQYVHFEMPYASGGSLARYLCTPQDGQQNVSAVPAQKKSKRKPRRRRRKRVPPKRQWSPSEEQALGWFVQLVSGVKFMHEHDVEEKN